MERFLEGSGVAQGVSLDHDMISYPDNVMVDRPFNTFCTF